VEPLLHLGPFKIAELSEEIIKFQLIDRAGGFFIEL
jgi:hypothetical protein